MFVSTLDVSALGSKLREFSSADLHALSEGFYSSPRGTSSESSLSSSLPPDAGIVCLFLVVQQLGVGLFVSAHEQSVSENGTGRRSTAL